jgi:hypothetical protein
MLPNFIGIGAPKSGTTWLFKCLDEHPEIFITPVKETLFFDYPYHESKIPEYEAYFSDAAGAVAVGEISTNYLTSQQAPERIRRHIPNVRLFVSLRNPLDQIYSHYWHLSRQNFHSSDRRRWSFEEALEKYEKRLIEPALYSHHLQRWLQYFERSQLLIIFYDDICKQPEEVIKKIYSFLEVERTFVPVKVNQKDSSVRQGTSPKSRFLGGLYATLYDRLNRQLYCPLTRLVGNQTAATIRDALRVRQVMQLLFYRKGYPQMNPQTRTLLRDRFAQEIQNLADLAGCDLSHWK